VKTYPDPLLIAYVPVIHRGYLDFFRRYVGKQIYILGESILEEFPEITRDMRALSPAQAQIMVRNLNVFTNTDVLEVENIRRCANQYRIVMPNEEVSRAVAEKYFGDREVSFEPIFLRWDKKAVTAFSKVNPDHTVSQDQLARELLGVAYKEAAKSSDWWRQVGGVAARDGKILFQAHNVHMPSEQTPYILGDPRSGFNAGEQIELSSALHAEIGIITHAASQGVSLQGADLYVTTFPCSGCARAIAAPLNGIRRVFYAEGYSQLEGEEVLRSRGIEIVRVEMETPSS
jgi:dCMP deaminase